MYHFIYRLNVDYRTYDTSTPLNVKDRVRIDLTDAEAIENAMGILDAEKNVRAWEITKHWFPNAGGHAVKCEVLASHNVKGSRLEFPCSAFSEID